MRSDVPGLLFLLVLGFMAVQPAAGAVIGMDWQIETVQSTGTAGQPSMAVDQQRGEIHVSYYSLADGSGELRYAHQDRSGWHRSTVDTGGSANVGQTSAIALRNGFPVIAYVDATSHALKFAEFAILTGWTVSTLDGPDSGRMIDGCPAMVALSDGTVWITYRDATNGDLVAQWWSPATHSWTRWYVDSNVGAGSDEDPAPSMMVDYRQGQDHPTPGVLYTRKSGGKTQVAYRYFVPSWVSGGYSRWDHDPYFDGSKGSARDHPSLAFRYAAYQLPVWCDTTADDQLRYGSYDQRYDDARSDYPITVNDAQLHAYHTSLALHPCNLSSIAYTDPATNLLMYAWNDGFWHTSFVDSLSNARGVMNRPTLALDGSGNPIICYYADSAGEVRIARTNDAYPAIPASKSYEPYLALIQNQGDSSGCGFFSYLHATEILKEMEAPYTPDPSFQFTHYIWWQNLKNGTDPRVPHVDDVYDHAALEIYGQGLETDYPSNYDRFGPDWETGELLDPPSDQAFANAANYRLADHSDGFWRPTAQMAERLLAVNGPLICYHYYKDHVVALIGYDRDRQELTLVDSANWGGIPYGAVKKASYEEFDKTMTGRPWSAVNALKNRGTPLLHPFTARINVTHPTARSYLEVSIGAVGHAPLVVWNQNNRKTAGKFDWVKTLEIDVALPAYAADHWPPSAANPWYVEVVDHNPEKGGPVRVNEVTLVKRWRNHLGSVATDTYRPVQIPVSVLPRGTATVFVPGTAGVVAVPGGAGVPTDTDDDGKCDDVNGNGRKDFADVVLYFNRMSWIAANEPVSAFDCNGNGRIDFADVVWLFDHL